MRKPLEDLEKRLHLKKIGVFNTWGKIYLGMAIYSAYITFMYLGGQPNAMMIDGLIWLAFSLGCHQYKWHLEKKLQEKEQKRESD